jgi:hypothetical protein
LAKDQDGMSLLLTVLSNRFFKKIEPDIDTIDC